MSRAYTSNGKRKSSMTHAKRVHRCLCGRTIRGNGGWSSHRKACLSVKAFRAANAPVLAPTQPPAQEGPAK